MLKAKFHVRSRQEWPGSPPTYTLGAVCRGDENREWASATPAGTLSVRDDESGVLASLWDLQPTRVDSSDGFAVLVHPTREVYVHISEGGSWRLTSCEFMYAGVQVTFVGGDGQKLTMTVNNAPAVKSIREAFIGSLRIGNPALFSVALSPVDA